MRVALRLCSASTSGRDPDPLADTAKTTATHASRRILEHSDIDPVFRRWQADKAAGGHEARHRLELVRATTTRLDVSGTRKVAHLPTPKHDYATIIVNKARCGVPILLTRQTMDHFSECPLKPQLRRRSTAASSALPFSFSFPVSWVQPCVCLPSIRIRRGQLPCRNDRPKTCP
jgi:hypothetical protein